MSDRQLRIAVVGVGAMGREHCATIIECVPEMRLAAVVDRHAETVARVGEEFGVPAFMDAEALVDAGCADAALIAVPHPLHAAAAESCLGAGLHVLCEKPLSDTIGAADRMVQCARTHGLVFGVMFQRRFEPVMQAALAFARAGKIGKLLRAMVIVPEYRTQRYFDSNAWRATWKGEGGGVLLNQAPHLLDIFCQLVWLPSSLMGRVETRSHDIEVEDHAEAWLRFADGGSGYLCCSTAEPRQGETIEIVGDTGKLLYRDRTLECHAYAEGLSNFTRQSTEVWGRPTIERSFLTTDDTPVGHFSVMRNFARHILFGDPLQCDGASGLAALELANAVTLSSYTGKEVSLPIDRAAYDTLLQQLRDTSSTVKAPMIEERVVDPQFIRR